MLLSLHVKNLALIEEEEVTFTDGLNILTGETGAGKSIILGSVNLALGGKADRSIIRTGKDYALIELAFRADNERQLALLEEMDLPVDEDGTILIKRKILPGRNICTICGESVPIRQLREISGALIDIYGQRENQKLLRREAQLQTLDEYAGAPVQELKEKVAGLFRTWKKLREEWDGGDMDISARKREMDLISYEIREIEEAGLREGEDEELEKLYRLMGSFRRINEAAGAAFYMISEGDSNAQSLIERALRELSSVNGIDEDLDQAASQLAEIDSLLSDFSRTLSDYISGLTFDPREFEQIQDRLNLINHLKDKYGDSIDAILKAGEARQARLDFLTDYEAGRDRLKKELSLQEKRLLEACALLSEKRQEAAASFAAAMKEALLDLNFNQVEFKVDLTGDPAHVGEAGFDQVRYDISMNPGEALRPLDQIASGGELSRIMLALKTVFAGKDELYSFIFDEIDTGISGHTAWKVSEKLGRLSESHQILCITHLPQIAAMENSHYLIAKESTGGRTMTHITRLSEEESDRELARLLGGASVSEAALGNAREMKRQARQARQAGKTGREA
ncbi:MAG: DNA repair protein RecN [bacterium]